MREPGTQSTCFHDPGISHSVPDSESSWQQIEDAWESRKAAQGKTLSVLFLGEINSHS